MFEKFLKQHKGKAYFIFRVLIGLLYFQHGLQKVFGLLGGTAQPIFSLMGFVGLMELLGGLAIALGVFTRLAAFGNVFIMAAAFFKAHFKFGDFPAGWIPVMNRGELALVYFAAFVLIMFMGSGKCGLEKKFLKKEFF